MASQLQKHLAKHTPDSTTDAVTWTTIAYYPLDTNASFVLDHIWVLGKDAAGNTASAIGTTRGKRVAGVVTIIGSLVDIVTMIVGSDAALNTSLYRINISSNDVQLQVKGVAATTIEWFGGFTIKIH
jgi:hypothetical protein